MGGAMLTFRSLQHKFGIELQDGTKQTRTSTLVEYGSTEPGGYSAMAKLGESFC
jgi:saccharopine dehydrogenase (NADP+, L-glutamate forming)